MAEDQSGLVRQEALEDLGIPLGDPEETAVAVTGAVEVSPEDLERVRRALSDAGLRPHQGPSPEVDEPRIALPQETLELTREALRDAGLTPWTSPEPPQPDPGALAPYNEISTRGAGVSREALSEMLPDRISPEIAEEEWETVPQDVSDPVYRRIRRTFTRKFNRKGATKLEKIDALEEFTLQTMPYVVRRARAETGWFRKAADITAAPVMGPASDIAAIGGAMIERAPGAAGIAGEAAPYVVPTATSAVKRAAPHIKRAGTWGIHSLLDAVVWLDDKTARRARALAKTAWDEKKRSLEEDSLVPDPVFFRERYLQNYEDSDASFKDGLDAAKSVYKLLRAGGPGGTPISQYVPGTGQMAQAAHTLWGIGTGAKVLKEGGGIADVVSALGPAGPLGSGREKVEHLDREADEIFHGAGVQASWGGYAAGGQLAAMGLMGDTERIDWMRAGKEAYERGSEGGEEFLGFMGLMMIDPLNFIRLPRPERLGGVGITKAGEASYGAYRESSFAARVAEAESAGARLTDNDLQRLRMESDHAVGEELVLAADTMYRRKVPKTALVSPEQVQLHTLFTSDAPMVRSAVDDIIAKSPNTVAPESRLAVGTKADETGLRVARGEEAWAILMKESEARRAIPEVRTDYAGKAVGTLDDVWNTYIKWNPIELELLSGVTARGTWKVKTAEQAWRSSRIIHVTDNLRTSMMSWAIRKKPWLEPVRRELESIAMLEKSQPMAIRGRRRLARPAMEEDIALTGAQGKTVKEAWVPVEGVMHNARFRWAELAEMHRHQVATLDAQRVATFVAEVKKITDDKEVHDLAVILEELGRHEPASEELIRSVGRVSKVEEIVTAALRGDLDDLPEGLRGELEAVKALEEFGEAATSLALQIEDAYRASRGNRAELLKSVQANASTLKAVLKDALSDTYMRQRELLAFTDTGPTRAKIQLLSDSRTKLAQLIKTRRWDSKQPIEEVLAEVNAFRRAQKLDEIAPIKDAGDPQIRMRALQKEGILPEGNQAEWSVFREEIKGGVERIAEKSAETWPKGAAEAVMGIMDARATVWAFWNRVPEGMEAAWFRKNLGEVSPQTWKEFQDAYGARSSSQILFSDKDGKIVSLEEVRKLKLGENHRQLSDRVGEAEQRLAEAGTAHAGAKADKEAMSLRWQMIDQPESNTLAKATAELKDLEAREIAAGREVGRRLDATLGARRALRNWVADHPDFTPHNQPDFMQGLTEFPAFKEWFGDSKVVDEAGKPLRVYHGTPEGRLDEAAGRSNAERERILSERKRLQGEIDAGNDLVREMERKRNAIPEPTSQYDPNFGKRGRLLEERATFIRDVLKPLRKEKDALPPVSARRVEEEIFRTRSTGQTDWGYRASGAYFTDSRAVAEGYAKGRPTKTPHVYETYLSIKNPYIDGVTKDASFTKELFERVERARGQRRPQDWLEAREKETALIRREVLQKHGYDGEIWKQADGSSEYVVFEPTQVKSTSNVGTWAKDDPRILYMRGADELTKVSPQSALAEAPVGVGALSGGQLSAKLKELADGREIAKWLAASADDAATRVILDRILPHLDDVSVKVIDLGDPAPPEIASGWSRGLAETSIRDRSTIKIWLRGSELSGSGVNAETVAHELLHAATARRMVLAKLLANQDTPLAKAWGELNDLVKVVGRERNSRFSTTDFPGPNNINADELMAWGLTNKRFQEFLRTVEIDGKSAFTRFVEVVADLLGLGKAEHNALTEVIRLTDEILSADVKALPEKRVYTRGDPLFMRGADELADVQLTAQAAVDPATSPIFYSRLENVLETAPDNLKTVGEFRKWLTHPKRQQRGIKAEEMRDTLVADLDDAAAITKDELLQYIRDNRREWSERVETYDDPHRAAARRLSGPDDNTIRGNAPETHPSSHYDEGWADGPPGPKGKDYTEITFSLNELRPEEQSVKSFLDGVGGDYHYASDFLVDAGIRYNDNVFMHVRFDTITVDGKKTLRLLEIQSDLHSAGRHEGASSGGRWAWRSGIYDDIMSVHHSLGHRGSTSRPWGPGGRGLDDLDAATFSDRLRNDVVATDIEHGEAVRRGGSRIDRVEATIERFKDTDDGYLLSLWEDTGGSPGLLKSKLREIFKSIDDELQPLQPNVPFKKSWQAIGFRRVAKWAADNGHEQIRWQGGAPRVKKGLMSAGEWVGGKWRESPAKVLYDEKTVREAGRVFGKKNVKPEGEAAVVSPELRALIDNTDAEIFFQASPGFPTNWLAMEALNSGLSLAATKNLAQKKVWDRLAEHVDEMLGRKWQPDGSDSGARIDGEKLETLSSKLSWGRDVWTREGGIPPRILESAERALDDLGDGDLGAYLQDLSPDGIIIGEVLDLTSWNELNFIDRALKKLDEAVQEGGVVPGRARAGADPHGVLKDAMNPSGFSDWIGELAKEEAKRFADKATPTHWNVEVTPTARAKLVEEGAPLYMREPGRGKPPLAATVFGDDGVAIIKGFESATLDSLVHEIGHVFRRDLPKSDLGVAEAWLGRTPRQGGIGKDKLFKKDGTWSELAEEVFAQAFVRYLKDGVLPKGLDPAVRTVFEKFKHWLTEVYYVVVGRSKKAHFADAPSAPGTSIEIKLSPQIRGVFDRLIDVDASRQTALGREVTQARKALELSTGSEQVAAYIKFRESATRLMRAAGYEAKRIGDVIDRYVSASPVDKAKAARDLDDAMHIVGGRSVKQLKPVEHAWRGSPTLKGRVGEAAAKTLHNRLGISMDEARLIVKEEFARVSKARSKSLGVAEGPAFFRKNFNDIVASLASKYSERHPGLKTVTPRLGASDPAALGLLNRFNVASAEKSTAGLGVTRKQQSDYVRAAKELLTHVRRGDDGKLSPAKRTEAEELGKILQASEFGRPPSGRDITRLNEAIEGAERLIGDGRLLDEAEEIAFLKEEIPPESIERLKEAESWLKEEVGALEAQVKTEMMQARRDSRAMDKATAEGIVDRPIGKKSDRGAFEGMARKTEYEVDKAQQLRMAVSGEKVEGPEAIATALSKNAEKRLSELPQASEDLVSAAELLGWDTRSPGQVWQEVISVRQRARSYGDYAQLRREAAIEAFKRDETARVYKGLSHADQQKIIRIVKNRHLYGVSKDASPAVKGLAKRLGMDGTEELFVYIKGKKAKVGDVYTDKQIEKALECAELLDDLLSEQLNRLQAVGKLEGGFDPKVLKQLRTSNSALAEAKAAGAAADDIALIEARIAELEGKKYIKWDKEEFLTRVNVGAYAPHMLSSVSRDMVRNLRGSGLLPTNKASGFERFRSRASLLDDVNEVARDDLGIEMLYHNSVNADGPAWSPAVLDKAGKVVSEAGPFADKDIGTLVEASRRGMLKEQFTSKEWRNAINWARESAKLNKLYDVFETDLFIMTERYMRITDKSIRDTVFLQDMKNMFPMGKEIGRLVAKHGTTWSEAQARQFGYSKLQKTDSLRALSGISLPTELKNMEQRILELLSRHDPGEVVNILRREGFNVDTPVIEAFKMDDIYLPTPVIEYLRWMNKMDPAQNRLFQFVDGLHALSKSMVTVASLAHIGMNFTGNYVSVAQKIGGSALNPVHHANAVSIFMNVPQSEMTAFKKIVGLKHSDVPIKLGDRVQTVGEWRAIFDDTGIAEQPLSAMFLKETMGGGAGALDQGMVWRQILGAGGGGLVGAGLGGLAGGPLGAAAGGFIGQYVGAAAAELVKLGRKRVWNDEVLKFNEAVRVNSTKGPRKFVPYFGEKAVGMTVGSVIGSVFGPAGIIGGAIAGLTMPSYMRMMTGLNQSVEMQARLTLGVAEISRGKTAQMAADSVNDALRNYSHLTPFERHYLRRFFFFYTWDAGNIRFQIHQFIKEPRQAAVFKNFMMGVSKGQFSESEIQAMPENLRYKVVLRTGANRAWVVNGLPQSAFIEMGGRFKGRLPVGLITRIRPELLTAVEGVFNHSLYYGKGWDELTNVRQLANSPPLLARAVGLPVARDEKTGQWRAAPTPVAEIKNGRPTGKYYPQYRAANPKVYYLMSKLPGWRPLMEHNKLVTDSFTSRALEPGSDVGFATDWERMLAFALGHRPYSIDFAAQQRGMEARYLKALLRLVEGQDSSLLYDVTRASTRIPPADAALSFPKKVEDE